MRPLVLAIALLVPTVLSADGVPPPGGDVVELPSCGSVYSQPFADPSDAGARACSPPMARVYVPSNKGLGFDLLDLESEACFVADEIYQRLDEIVEVATTRIRALGDPKNLAKNADGVRAMSAAIGEVLAERNYGLYIPTNTLGDALQLRNTPGEPERHIFDCDTGSFIYLSVAESLGLPASLVEITLPSGTGHNYVRWQVTRDLALDWDTNGRAQCQTPKGTASYEGKGMSRRQVLGYFYGIRAGVWKRNAEFGNALQDFRESIDMYPESPDSRNNLAWMIATRDFVGRAELGDTALVEAQRAVDIERTANFLDTLACAYAFAGKFDAAKKALADAIKLDGSTDLSGRQERFAAKRDCTGIE